MAFSFDSSFDSFWQLRLATWSWLLATLCKSVSVISVVLPSCSPLVSSSDETVHLQHPATEKRQAWERGPTITAQHRQLNDFPALCWQVGILCTASAVVCHKDESLAKPFTAKGIDCTGDHEEHCEATRGITSTKGPAASAIQVVKKHYHLQKQVGTKRI